MALPDQPPDPHGALAWINAVLETLKQAYAALVVPLGALVLWMVKRKDRAQERADARQKSDEEAHQRIADQLDRESAERFEAMRQENVQLRAENRRLAGLSRRWFDLAHDMRGEGGRRARPGEGMPPLSYDPDAP